MNITLILGRGQENCGVTRFALEFKDYLDKHTKINSKIYASIDKKWLGGRKQNGEIIKFSNDQIKSIATNINNESDYVIYLSLPSKKSHTEEYKDLFYNELVCNICKPKKLMLQLDHKRQSLSRNDRMIDIAKQMDALFTHSLDSNFTNVIQENNVVTNVNKFDLGMDFDSLKQEYYIPAAYQVRRMTFFSRYATFKDPLRMLDFYEELKNHNFITEMRGVERSFGSMPLFYEDINNRENGIRSIIKWNRKNTAELQNEDYLYIYGTYERDHGLRMLSDSMFGADFYHLENGYGNNFEFAMCEIIGVGCIPIFDIHWANNCTHKNGKLFSDLKDFALYSDKNDIKGTVKEMKSLAGDNTKRNRLRNKSFEIAKAHCDIKVTMDDLLEKIKKVNKKSVLF